MCWQRRAKRSPVKARGKPQQTNQADGASPAFSIRDWRFRHGVHRSFIEAGLDVQPFPRFFGHQMDWIREKSAKTLNPGQVETTLERMEARWPAEAKPLRELVEKFPLGEGALLHLISVSSVCAARFTRHPEILLWLSRPEISGEEVW